MKKNPTVVFACILGGYVLLQFLWWGYQLISLTNKVSKDADYINNRVWMILGEGSVFLALLVFGIVRIIKLHLRDAQIAKAQNNFMLAVTHELKTPIAAVQLNLQTSKRSTISEDKKQEFIENALNENKRLESLVQQMLTASQLEQNAMIKHIESVDLNLLIDENVRLFSSRYQLPVKVFSKVKNRFLTDTKILESIIQNILQNAVKYGASPKGVEINLSENQLGKIIAIRDFGQGIPKEKATDIFKKFYRVENEETRQTKGTGLGLFIAYECTRALGGQLKINFTQVPGACFEIHLPNE